MKNLKVAYLIISLFIALVITGYIYLGRDEFGGLVPYWFLLILFFLLSLIFYGVFYYFKLKKSNIVVKDSHYVKENIFKTFSIAGTVNYLLNISSIIGLIINFINPTGIIIYGISIFLRSSYFLLVIRRIENLTRIQPHPYGSLIKYDIIAALALILAGISYTGFAYKDIVNSIIIVLVINIDILETRKIAKIKNYYGLSGK